MRAPYLVFVFILNLSLTAYSQVANFNIPDTVCLNQSITIQNTSTGNISDYWNFCSGNLGTTPIGVNMGNLGSLNGPVYSAIAKEGDDYFVFISNINDGTITRLAYGNSLTNTPVPTNLGNLGVMGYYIEGIQIKKDDITGKWFGLIAWGQIDYLIRLDFGNSLNNVPTAVNLGNIGDMMRFAHTIYTFSEGGNWYSFIGNNGTSTIIRLNFGNSLGNTPTATYLSNVGGLNGPVGLYPIQENGTWYLFVVNRNSNTLSRLNFGNSLLNTPSGVNLGDVGGTMHSPRSVTFLKDCGKIFGFVVNEASNDIVRLTFPNGLLSAPTGSSLGNIANFSFPHHISELFRVGDSLYAFIMNVNNNTISRLCFASCNNSSIPSSNLQNPPVFSYNSPGVYNISLVINEGLPSQSNVCKEVYVKKPTAPKVSGDTTLCTGDPLNLITSANPGDSFLWIGPNGYTSTSQNLNIPNMNVNNAGKYTLTVRGCTTVSVDKMVSVAESPIVTGDTSICTGDTLHLFSNAAAGNSFLWTGPNGFTSTNQNLIIPNSNINNTGKYYFSVNGCANMKVAKFVNVVGRSTFSGDTLICAGDTLQLYSNSASGDSYYWTGPNGFTSTSQNLIIPDVNVNTSGKYTLTVNGCTNVATDMIVNVAESPTVTGDTIICSGDTLHLSASGTPGNYYFWTGPNGFTSTNQNLIIPNSNINNTGNYYFSVNGCANMNVAKFVNVVGSPTVSGDTLICAGDTLQLSSSFTSGNSYYWTGPNGFTSTSQNLIIPDVNVNTSGKYTLTVNGCTNVATDMIVNVAASPTVTGDTIICSGDTLHLSASGTPGNYYFWTGPNGFTSTNQNLIIPNSNINNTGNYYFSVNGCSNMNVAKFVNVVGSPTVSGDTLICAGDTLQLSSSFTSGNSYYWTGPNGFSSTSQYIIVSGVNVNTIGKYTLTVNGCTNLAVHKMVGVAEIPTVTGDSTVCAGDTLKLFSNFTQGNNYFWTGPNGFLSTSQNLIISDVNVNNTGKYTLTINACANTAVNKIITIAPVPEINLGNDTTICLGSALILNAGNPGCNYQWNTGADSQTISVETSGTYSVNVVNGLCKASDEIFIDYCGSELWFPNVFTPNNDGLNERFRPVSLRQIASFQITIFNRWGQKLYESDDAYTGWDGTYKGNICPDGVYYYIAEYILGLQNSSFKQMVTRGAVTILR